MSIERDITELKSKLLLVKAQLKDVERYMGELKNELERAGVTDIKNVGKMLTEIRREINENQESVKDHLRKAETLLNKYERIRTDE